MKTYLLFGMIALLAACTKDNFVAKPNALNPAPQEATTPQAEVETPATETPAAEVAPVVVTEMTEAGEQSDDKIIPADRGENESDLHLQLEFKKFVINGARLNSEAKFNDEKLGMFTFQNGQMIEGAALSTSASQVYCQIRVMDHHLQAEDKSFQDIELDGSITVGDVFYGTKVSLPGNTGEQKTATNEAAFQLRSHSPDIKHDKVARMVVTKQTVGESNMNMAITVGDLKSCFGADKISVHLVPSKK